MKDFVKRLVEEKIDLGHDIKKLEAFLDSGEFDKLDAREKYSLILQRDGMREYYKQLNRRVYFYTNGKWPEDD